MINGLNPKALKPPELLLGIMHFFLFVKKYMKIKELTILYKGNETHYEGYHFIK